MGKSSLVFALLFCSVIGIKGQPSAEMLDTLTSGKREINEFRFSSRGDFFYALNSDGKFTVWDVEKREQKFQVEGTRNVSVDPNDKYILVFVGKESRILDALTGKIISVLQRSVRSSEKIAWTKDGNLIAAWIDKYNVGIFHTLDGSLLHTLNIRKRKRLATQRFFDWPMSLDVQFTPDKKNLLIVSGDVKAELWSVEKGTVIFTFEDKLRQGYLGAIPSRQGIIKASISLDGKWILTSNYSGARIWNAENGQLTADFDGYFSANFSPDSRYVGPLNLADHKGMQLYDLRDQELKQFGDSYTGRFGVWSQDGRLVILDRTIDEVSKREAYLWDIETQEMLWTTKTYAKHCFDPISTCLSDLDRFHFSHDAGIISVSNNKRVLLADSRVVTDNVVVISAVGPVSWSPKEMLLLTKSQEKGKFMLFKIRS